MKTGKCAAQVLILALVLSFFAFAPEAAAAEEPVTRGGFITALYALSGGQGDARQDTFADVPGEGELARALRWAVDRGIVNGYGNGLFGPQDPVTREQAVTMLYRSARALEQDPEGDWRFPLGAADAETVSSYAEKAVEWAVMNRILSGTGSIRPKAAVTEAELTALLDGWQRFLIPAGESRGILILYTSAVHCGIDKGFGSAGLQAVRDALTAQGYDVILVDDGDSIQGEAVGTFTKGEAMIPLMNKLGYSVAIPGNHEFDYGAAQFLRLAEEASFPYISCNLVHNGERVFDSYVIRELGGRKLAFVGVTTPETITSSTPTIFQNEKGEYIYGFLRDRTGEAVYGAVQAAADAARADGADYVVLLGHLGNQAACSPWTYGDVISHTSGIDVILDGHSHDTDQVTVKNSAGETVLRSACGTKLENIGWCSITPEGKISTGLYAWSRNTPAPEALGLDNDLSRAVAEATEDLNRRLGETVGHTDTELTIYDAEVVGPDGKPIRMVRRMETNLGDLCADALRDQSGADIAVVNGGGIRASIPAGDITLEDIYRVFTFGNNMCMVEATGRQILDALEWGARSVPGEFGGFLQVSGLTYEIHSYIASPCAADENGMFRGTEGERRVKNVMVAGVPLDPEKTYTLAGSDYLLLNQGDGFTMFDGAPVLMDCGKLDNQMLMDHILDTLGGVVGEDYGTPWGQGRIVILEEPAA